MLKPVSDLTEAEVRRAMGRDAYWRADHPDRAALQDRVGAWFDHVYGQAPQPLDESGKPVRGTPKNPPPTRERPLQTARGEGLDAALSQVAQGLAQHFTAAMTGAPQKETPSQKEIPAQTIRHLQAGLNLTERGPGARLKGTRLKEAPLKEARLKEDGILGPKTARAVRRRVMRSGSGKPAEVIGLSRIAEAAKTPSDRTALRNAVDTGLAPLYPGSAETRRKTGTRALQIGLNAVTETQTGLGETPLKEDGVLGPKTQRAFDQTARRQGSTLLAQTLGDTLNFG